MSQRSISLLWLIVALVAFASNSLLCRGALRHNLIDPGTFTVVRLVSGALVLALTVRLRNPSMARSGGGSWASAALLVSYAAPFSFAYIHLPAGTGAVILFGTVQVTMIAGDVLGGRRPNVREWAGLLLSFTGLILLTRPGLDAPDPVAAVLMGVAGMSWGAYSLRARNAEDPLSTTRGNFLRGSVLVLPLLFLGYWLDDHVHLTGISLAVASGAAASGLGYAVWYRALRTNTATQAAVAQLLVPLLAAVGGVAFLEEEFTVRLFVSGTIIATGVALAILKFRPRAQD